MQGGNWQFQPWPNASYVTEKPAAASIDPVGVSKNNLSYANIKRSRSIRFRLD